MVCGDLHLPRPQHIWGNMAKTIRQSRSYHCRCSVHWIPNGNPKWLLDATIPLSGEDGKERHASGFKETQEETNGDQTCKAIACSSTCCCNSPTEHHWWHQNTGRDLHNEPCREWLPRQLRDRGNGRDQRILASNETSVLLKIKNRSRS